MKTIFKQKLLVLFAALLALCLLAAGIGMLAAPHTAQAAGESIDITEQITLNDFGDTWNEDQSVKDTTQIIISLGALSLDKGNYINDNPTTFPVDLADYIVIGDRVDADGISKNGKTVRQIVSENEAGTTSYAGVKFPMSAGASYSPVLIYTAQGADHVQVMILKDFKQQGDFTITIKAGFTVTCGGVEYTTTEDIVYSYVENFNGSSFVYNWSRFYEITWNVDGTETKQLVAAGLTPTFNGATPEKESTVSTEYTFAGWDTTPTAATANATYTAQFRENPREYDITFMNGAQQIVVVPTAYGTAPVYNGAEPTRDPTDAKSYIFAGWSATDGGEVLETLPEVVGEATYYAVFTETERQYTVTLMNGDKQFAQEHVVYGSTPAYSGEAPTKAADAQYTYTFAGWSDTEDGEVIDLSSRTVKSDVTYYAVYTETLNEYTVTIAFTGIDGKEAQTLTLAYGTKIDFAQFAEDGYSFTVSGGQGTVDSFTVTGDAQLTVAYTEAAGPNTPEEPEAGLTPGAIAGIVIACVAVVAAAVAIGVIVRKKRG